MLVLALTACSQFKEETYRAFADIRVGESLADFQARAADLEQNGFTVGGGEQEMWIFKRSLLDVRTSNPIIILKLAEGRISGKGIRMLDGPYTLCDAPLDVGQMPPAKALPNGRPCL